ncbi:MAG: hypothetical protein H7X97_09420 [Opitutaceae bacterium]|nr:hypothetical protein [Verrucomicrobiales bacterium]
MNLRAIGIVSLALNLLLGAAIIALLRLGPAQPSSVVRVIRALPASTNDRIRTVSTNVIEARAFRWSDLESEDYHVYIANLRAADCPEKSIRQIISADIHQLYETRMELPVEGEGFWLTGNRRRELERTAQARRDALREEKRALLSELLGSPMDPWELQKETGSEPEVDLILGFISASQADRVMDAILQSQCGFRSFEQSLDDILTPEDDSVVRTKVDAFQAELASFLSPQEMVELKLRVADVMKNLFGQRIPLAGISGAEYREITRIEAQEGDVFATILNAKTDSPDPSEINEDIVREQLEEFLGPKKFAAYERAGDPRFREPYEIGRQFSLPVETSIRVYELRKLAENEWTQASSAEDISADDLAQQRRRVAAEARAGLEKVLRGKPLEEYLKRDPFWFRISRDTQPGTSGAPAQ